MKQLQPDPWSKISEYFYDSVQKVTVRNFTNFGIFVELEEGVDGLIHISDFGLGRKKIKHPSDFTKVGEVIDAKVLELDLEVEKLSLVKQPYSNPWDYYESVFTEGSEHEGEVKDITKNGATIVLTHGVESFAPKRHLSKEDGSKVEIGEKLNSESSNFKRNLRKLLTYTIIYKEFKNEKQKTKKNVSKAQKSQQKSTLGDMDELML